MDITKDNIETKKCKINTFQIYLLYFFIFSFFGWLMETIYSFIVLGHFTERGFLYGPICPIYGYGALILIIFLSIYKDNSLKLFIYSSVIFSIFEYFVSYLLEALFNSFWWDYTNDFFNLNGRISIFYSIAWGVIAILFVGHFYPFLKKKIDTILSKIPYKIQNITLNVFFIIFIIDTILSCVKYLK